MGVGGTLMILSHVAYYEFHDIFDVTANMVKWRMTEAELWNTWKVNVVFSLLNSRQSISYTAPQSCSPAVLTLKLSCQFEFNLKKTFAQQTHCHQKQSLACNHNYCWEPNLTNEQFIITEMNRWKSRCPGEWTCLCMRYSRRAATLDKYWHLVLPAHYAHMESVSTSAVGSEAKQEWPPVRSIYIHITHQHRLRLSLPAHAVCEPIVSPLCSHAPGKVSRGAADNSKCVWCFCQLFVIKD